MRTTAVRIEEDSLLGPAERVRVARGDTTLTKTVRDLLREKLTEITINGDPLAKNESIPVRRGRKPVAVSA
jgi:hypothetical protein